MNLTTHNPLLGEKTNSARIRVAPGVDLITPYWEKKRAANCPRYPNEQLITPYWEKKPSAQPAMDAAMEPHNPLLGEKGSMISPVQGRVVWHGEQLWKVMRCATFGLLTMPITIAHPDVPSWPAECWSCGEVPCGRPGVTAGSTGFTASTDRSGCGTCRCLVVRSSSPPSSTRPPPALIVGRPQPSAQHMAFEQRSWRPRPLVWG